MSAPPASQEETSPYNEAEFLGFVTDIYDALIRQGHFSDADAGWPPPEGHAIDPTSIDKRVVSLMKKLPAGPDACIAPNMVRSCVLRSDFLIRSRGIDKPVAMSPARVDQTNALPTVLLLLDGFESTDPVLVLDVADDTIRFFDQVYEGPHYLEFPAENAPTYLKRMLENYRNGTWISNFDGGIMQTDWPYPASALAVRE
ncbi:hypothetical protein LTR85_000962 [Meristemomyces frigidus]|nr:hypothetical protein LTR85_000962 [Meristemomyces frigidus]